MAPSAGAILWVPLVTRIQQMYPEIELQIHDGYSGNVIEWLAHGTADIGVVYQPQPSSTVDVDLLVTERLYLLASAHEPLLEGVRSITFRELCKLPLVLPTRAHAIRRLLEQMAQKHQAQLNVRLEVNAYPAIKSLVIARRGFTVLPVAPVLPEVHAGQIAIADIAQPSLTQTIGIVTGSHRQLSLAARTVVGLIRELVGQFIEAGRWPAVYSDTGPKRT
jgi:LysR family nitrogen assimilation transcriptional regulator